MAVLADPSKTPAQLEALQAAARRRGVDLVILRLATREDIEPALDRAKAQGAQAVNLLASPLFNTALRPTLFTKATALDLPTISQWAEAASEGSAFAYGPSTNDIFRQIARMIAKLLQGTPPGQFPVEQPTTFKLAINLKTIMATKAAVPAAMLRSANELVE
jgi:putative ABC transport system substrate-binding protein